jgi:hypothetical protein
MSGDRRHTKCAVGRPLDGGVRQRSWHEPVLLAAAQSTAFCSCCAACTQALTHAFILTCRAFSAKPCSPALTRAFGTRQCRWPCAKTHRLYARLHRNSAAEATGCVRKPCHAEAAAPTACPCDHAVQTARRHAALARADDARPAATTTALPTTLRASTGRSSERTCDA